MEASKTSVPELPGDATAWHDLPVSRVLAAVSASNEGLSAAEARRRLAAVGPNALPPAVRAGPLTLIGRQIKSPIIYVLLGAAAVELVLGKLIDAAVVAGVVVVNTLIGFVQELRADEAIHALVELVPETATVLRDGVRAARPSAEVVPGDIVLLEAGDRVPADLRVASARNLRADEASLTGESLPVAKQVEPVTAEAGIADRRSMVYGGTLIASGSGAGIVVATGSRTELGRISSMMQAATQLETPLTRSLASVGRGLTIAIAAVTVAVVAIALLRGYPPLDALLSGVALAVAAIPEGLPAIVTIALSVGVQRMARRRAVVRKLPAVETLGSTSVICTDKTGTLTRNEMTVRALWTPSGRYALSGVGYAPEGRLHRHDVPLERAPDDVVELARAAALCSDATLRRADGTWVVAGDPTEGALIVAAEKLGLRAEEQRARWPRKDVVPFESQHRIMATLHDTPDGGQRVISKGAPEVVIARCERVAGGAPRGREDALCEAEHMASCGMRVLAVAARAPASRLETLAPEDASGWVLLGLVGMMDPPRPEAIEAVAACRRAGIAVKMITGDHPSTAAAVGAALGMLPEGGAVTGAILGGLSGDELREVAARRHVFARVAPEHKLRLVQALQADGRVVAMTGDGVNDAPALEQADVGVAMGLTGTAVAKEAADIVLTDDNFASVRAAVEEGRRVYDNLVKALAFLLPANVGQAMTILVAAVAFPILDGTPLMPILPLQILWINLVTSVTLALPLAFEAPEPDLMERPPRPPGEPILGAFILLRTLAVGALMTAGAVGLFLVEYLEQVEAHVPGALTLRESQTMAVTTLVLFQVFYLLNCRSLKGSIFEIGLFSNPLVYAGIAVLLVLQLGFVFLPFMNRLFDSAPLSASDWAKSTAVAMTVLPLVAFAKWWSRRSG